MQKAANIVDRVYRAEESNNQKNIISVNYEEGEFPTYCKVQWQMLRWTGVGVTENGPAPDRITAQASIIFIDMHKVQWEVQAFQERPNLYRNKRVYVHSPKMGIL